MTDFDPPACVSMWTSIQSTAKNVGVKVEVFCSVNVYVPPELESVIYPLTEAARMARFQPRRL